MIGITSYGAYVPRYRMGKETVGWGAAERAVACFDEDSITMGVAAAIDCLIGVDRSKVGGLLFASNTAPYSEKMAATLVATAADLSIEAITLDLAHSIRVGTTGLRMAFNAVKAGAAKQAMVVASDCRLGRPRSSIEQNGGDGAAALLLGDTDVVAELEGFYSVSQEIIDVWRPDGDKMVRSWEERFFLEEGYLKVVPQVVNGLLTKQGITLKDITKVVVYASDVRRHREMAQKLKLAPEQVQNPLFGALGNTGAALAPMMLVAALEQAKPGDRILVANYGNGADALLFKVTDNIVKARNHRGMQKHLASRRIIPDYTTYLWWRDLFDPDLGIQLRPKEIPSAPNIFRDQEAIYRLYGAKCKSCGTVQYPPQVLCTKCRAEGNFEKVRLADKKAQLFSYTLDALSGSKDSPLVQSVINFDGGGRMVGPMADREVKEVKIGMPLEMSFRRLYYADGIFAYFWK
ncbi:MAG: zinc ribbon domain-containing protein, partial [Dehalococcoidia bacterium]|nr:zinc ribbon domain-containing protein [Dehalococcoidia bacterium]